MAGNWDINYGACNSSKYIYICLLLHCIYMARIVEVSWQKLIFKPICSHVKVHFVMAVS